jgi:hypothetical protein
VVGQSTHDSKFGGSNPRSACTRREEIAKFLEKMPNRASDFGTNVSAPTLVPNCFQVPKQVPREECTNVPKQVPKQQVTLTGSNVENLDRWRVGTNQNSWSGSSNLVYS